MSVVETSFRIVASLVGANIFNRLSQSVTGVTTQAGRLRQAFQGASTSLKALAAGSAAVGLTNLVTGVIQTNVEIKKLADQSGMSTKFIAQLKGAVEATGGSFGDVEELMDSFNEKYVELGRGNEDIKRSFDAMGVSINDASGKIKTNETLLKDSIVALSEMKDGGIKSAIAMGGIADGAAKMLPVFNQGIGFIEEFGQSVDDDLIDSSMELNKLWVQMKERLSGITVSFAKGLFPALQDILKAFVGTNEAGKILQGSKSGWETFGKVVGNVFRMIAIALIEVRKQWLTFMGYLDSAPQVISILEKKIKGLFPWNRASTDITEESNIIATNLAKYQPEKDSLSNLQGNLASGIRQSNDGWVSTLGKYLPESAKGLVAQIKKTPQQILKEKREGFKGNKTYNSYLTDKDAEKKAADEAKKKAEEEKKAREKEAADAQKWISDKQLSNRMLLAEREEIGKTADEIERMRAVREFDNSVTEKANELHGTARDQLIKTSATLKQSMMEILKENQRLKALDEIKNWATAQSDLTKSYAEERQEIGLTADEVERLRMVRELDNEVSRQVVSYQGAVKDAFLQQADAIRAAREEELKKTQEARKSWTTGAKGFLTEYIDGISDTATQTKQAFESAFQGAEDALVGFLTGGKSSFADFTVSILQDMQRMIIRQTLLKPLADTLLKGLNTDTGGGGGGGGIFGSILGSLGSSLLGSIMGPTAAVASSTHLSSSAGLPLQFADGGIMTSKGSVPLHKYARGGIAKSPQMALFGEGSMAEAYVPLPDGRSIPVSLRGSLGGGGGSMVNNVTVNVNVDGSGGSKSNASANSDMGKNLGKLISDTVKQTIINEKRPGGILS